MLLIALFLAAGRLLPHCNTVFLLYLLMTLRRLVSGKIPNICVSLWLLNVSLSAGDAVQSFEIMWYISMNMYLLFDTYFFHKMWKIFMYHCNGELEIL